MPAGARAQQATLPVQVSSRPRGPTAVLPPAHAAGAAPRPPAVSSRTCRCRDHPTATAPLVSPWTPTAVPPTCTIAKSDAAGRGSSEPSAATPATAVPSPSATPAHQPHGRTEPWCRCSAPWTSSRGARSRTPAGRRPRTTTRKADPTHRAAGKSRLAPRHGEHLAQVPDRRRYPRRGKARHRGQLHLTHHRPRVVKVPWITRRWSQRPRQGIRRRQRPQDGPDVTRNRAGPRLLDTRPPSSTTQATIDTLRLETLFARVS